MLLYKTCISIQSYLFKRARVAQRVRQLDYLTTHTSLSPIRCGFTPGFVNYKKGCTRLAAARDKVYQLLAHGRWFSPDTSASSTTKTGRYDIAESGVKHNKSKLNQICLRNIVLYYIYLLKLTINFYEAVPLFLYQLSQGIIQNTIIF